MCYYPPSLIKVGIFVRVKCNVAHLNYQLLFIFGLLYDMQVETLTGLEDVFVCLISLNVSLYGFWSSDS